MTQRKTSKPVSERTVRRKIAYLELLDELEQLIEQNNGQLRYESVFRRNSERIQALIQELRTVLSGRGRGGTSLKSAGS